MKVTGVTGVSQSQWENDPWTKSSVCSASDREAIAASVVQNGSPERDEVAVTKAWIDRALTARAFSLHSCVASFDEQRRRPAFEAAGWGRFFSAARPRATGVGLNCSDSLSLRHPAAAAADWAVVLVHSHCCSSTRDISARSFDARESAGAMPKLT